MRHSASKRLAASWAVRHSESSDYYHGLLAFSNGRDRRRTPLSWALSSNVGSYPAPRSLYRCFDVGVLSGRVQPTQPRSSPTSLFRKPIPRPLFVDPRGAAHFSSMGWLRYNGGTRPG